MSAISPRVVMGIVAAAAVPAGIAAAYYLTRDRGHIDPPPPVTPPPVTPPPVTPPITPPVTVPPVAGQPSVPPGAAIRQVQTGQKLIALTFDDGPNGPTTDAILGVLAQHDAKATFYVVGNAVARSADKLRAMRDAGHAIGNHSWDHPQLTNLSDADVASQLSRTSDAIEAATGERPDTFRAPYGARNERVDSIGASVGMRDVLWSVDTEDWRKPGADAISSAAIAGARPGGIILMHDGGGDRSQTLASLDRTLTELSAQGYKFVTVPQLVAASGS